MLALAMLGFVGLELGVLSASTQTIGAEDRSVSAHGNSTRVALSGGSDISLADGSHLTVSSSGFDATLQSGEVLVSVRGLIRLRVGDAMVTAVHAGFFVSDSEHITIAAIDAPIVVSYRGRLLAVPGGYQVQLTNSTQDVYVSSVPTPWLDAKNNALIAMQPRFDLAGAQGNDATLAAAVSRDTPLTATDVASLLTTLNHMPQHTELLHLFALHAGSHRLLVPGAEGGFVDELFAMEDPREWLLALVSVVHMSGRPVPDSYVQRFEAAFERAAVVDPTSVLSTLLPQAAELPVLLDDTGYPAHAVLWRSTLRHDIEYIRSLVSAADRQSLDDLASNALRDSASREAADSAYAHARAVYAASGDGATRVTEVRDLLLSHGAMFTPQTSVVPLADNGSVRVSDVYFSTTGGDVSFDFSFDVDGTLRDIVRAHVPQLRSLTLDRFLSSL